MRFDLSQWPAISSLLDEALDLPARDRAIWLQRLSEEHHSLEPALRELLSRQDLVETGTFLKPLNRAGGDLAGAAQHGEFREGAIVGAYRLVRELGRGGMGAVWLAERTDGLLKRLVALKLPIMSLQHKSLAERFARERDILAALTHPHIARLYDAGITETGQPYLALEYVEGSPLTAYCDARRLSVAERLRLFSQVLGAVQYAHANLVIHRDLKPSNILVSDAGEVHLLDFGIAKLMTEGEARETELTQIGGRTLTPDYASPEQIMGAPLNTASDVYSLGVLLYELLTGERPYRLKRDSRAVLEEAILAADPVRPSQSIRDEQKAGARVLTAARLRRALAGDLDTIVLKALKKKPAERYATADAFMQDVQRYQAGEPVLAQPDRALYRLGKFVTRNRLAVGGASAVALVLIAATLVSLWQARIAREQATLAQREAKRAQAVQAFLLDIFRTNTHLQQDPIKARQATARDLLDIGAKRVGESLKDVPDAQAEVLLTLGDMYTQMGLNDRASELRLQRIDALKKAHGPLDPSVAEALLDYVVDIASSSDRGKSLPALEEAKRILDAAGDASSETRAGLWMEFARYYRYTSPEKMRAYADDAVRLLESKYRDTWTYPLALDIAARARFELGEYEASEALYRKSLTEVHRREPGTSAWEIAPLAQLAGTQAALVKVGEAEQNFRASLAASRKLNGDSHNETLQSGTRLGAFLHATSRREEGRRLMENALSEIARDKAKQGAAVVAVVNGFYGQSLLAEGRIDKAEKYLALDVDDARALYPQSSPLAKGLLRQGELYTALGRYDEARRALAEALAIWRQVGGGATDPAMENPYIIDQALLALAQGDAKAAIDLAGRVRNSANAARLPLLLDVAAARVVQANAYLRQNRLADAVNSARAALDEVQRSSVRNYFQTVEANAALALGEALRRSGDPKAARPYFERALKLREANDDAQSPWLAQTKIALAECLVDLGERDTARIFFNQASATQATHKELGEHFTKPLRELATRFGSHRSRGGDSRKLKARLTS